MNTNTIIGGIFVLAVIAGLGYCIYKIDQIEMRINSRVSLVPSHITPFAAQRPIGFKPEWSM